VAHAGNTTLNSGWLAALPSGAIPHLGNLRERAGIEVCEANGQVWLRGPALDEAMLRELRALLGSQVFQPLTDAQLLLLGATVPHGYAPHGDWHALRKWLTIRLPTKQFVAAPPAPARLELVRAAGQQAPSLVRLLWPEWSNYALTAPQVRLARLEFAACQAEVVVRGEPLPPLHGEYFYVRHGVAAPIGFDWHPALDARVLRAAWGCELDELVLLLRTGGHMRLRGDQFVAASRSAVRLTAGDSSHSGSGA